MVDVVTRANHPSGGLCFPGGAHGPRQLIAFQYIPFDCDVANVSGTRSGLSMETDRSCPLGPRHSIEELGLLQLSNSLLQSIAM